MEPRVQTYCYCADRIYIHQEKGPESDFIWGVFKSLDRKWNSKVTLKYAKSSYTFNDIILYTVYIVLADSDVFEFRILKELQFNFMFL